MRFNIYYICRSGKLGLWSFGVKEIKCWSIFHMLYILYRERCHFCASMLSSGDIIHGFLPLCWDQIVSHDIDWSMGISALISLINCLWYSTGTEIYQLFCLFILYILPIFLYFCNIGILIILINKFGWWCSVIMCWFTKVIYRSCFVVALPFKGQVV